MGLALLLLVAADAPQALRTASAGIFLIREGEVVEEALYVAGSVVRIAGTIEGDLVVLATERLVVSGRVEGDVIGFATTASITGVVDGSVRLAGVDLEIASEVGGDVVGLGRDIRLAGSIVGDSWSGRDRCSPGVTWATTWAAARSGPPPSPVRWGVMWR